MANLSRSALLDFLEYLSTKGLMNRTTAAARKAASNKVLGILDDSEASDVSKIDVDNVMARFANIEGGNYTPESLNTYKSRVRSSIDDFLRYQKDPLNFRPAVQTPSRRAERSTSAEDGQPRQETMRSIEDPPAAVNILPIPLRSDLTIKIQGLPFDLTVAEANKIANVVKALATQE